MALAEIASNSIEKCWNKGIGAAFTGSNDRNSDIENEPGSDSDLFNRFDDQVTAPTKQIYVTLLRIIGDMRQALALANEAAESYVLFWCADIPVVIIGVFASYSNKCAKAISYLPDCVCLC